VPEKPATRLRDIERPVPKGGAAALDFIKKTAELNGEMPFWRANKSAWTSLLPPGIRPYPEVGILDTSPEHVRNDYAMIKYLDGIRATIPTDKLYKGHVIYPGDVTKKWLVVKAGEKNIRGRLIETDA
jgi:hypothetical protein